MTGITLYAFEGDLDCDAGTFEHLSKAAGIEQQGARYADLSVVALRRRKNLCDDGDPLVIGALQEIFCVDETVDVGHRHNSGRQRWGGTRGRRLWSVKNCSMSVAEIGWLMR